MFTALANAIAFEVGFRHATFYASITHTGPCIEGRILRGKYIRAEFEELRTNSKLPEGTRAITAEFLGEAVACKVQAQYDAQHARDDVWYIVYSHRDVRPSHVKRTTYVSRSAAFAAVRKLNDRYNGGYAVRTARERVAARRLRLVQNIQTNETVLEAVGTPNYCSVASEAYWSA